MAFSITFDSKGLEAIGEFSSDMEDESKKQMKRVVAEFKQYGKRFIATFKSTSSKNKRVAEIRKTSKYKVTRTSNNIVLKIYVDHVSASLEEFGPTTIVPKNKKALSIPLPGINLKDANGNRLTPERIGNLVIARGTALLITPLGIPLFKLRMSVVVKGKRLGFMKYFESPTQEKLRADMFSRLSDISSIDRSGDAS